MSARLWLATVHVGPDSFSRTVAARDYGRAIENIKRRARRWGDPIIRRGLSNSDYNATAYAVERSEL